MHIKCHAQPVAVVHARVQSKAQIRGAALAFAQQLRLGISLARVRVVAALLAFEVTPAVAVAGLLGYVLRTEALHAGPGVDKRSVHAEVLDTGPATFAREIFISLAEQLGRLTNRELCQQLHR